MLKQFIPRFTRLDIDDDFVFQTGRPELYTEQAKALFQAAVDGGLFGSHHEDMMKEVYKDFILQEAEVIPTEEGFTTVPFEPETEVELGFYKYPNGFIHSLPALAYWCMKASTYLCLDKGRTTARSTKGKAKTPITNWKPFEDAFSLKPGTLRHALSSKGMYSKGDPEDGPDYVTMIDAFFSKLEMK